jgi:hypothetical protein
MTDKIDTTDINTAVSESSTEVTTNTVANSVAPKKAAYDSPQITTDAPSNNTAASHNDASVQQDQAGDATGSDLTGGGAPASESAEKVTVEVHQSVLDELRVLLHNLEAGAIGEFDQLRALARRLAGHFNA